MDAKHDPAVMEYIAEGKEIIERVSKNLSVLEKDLEGTHTETLGSLYRDVHTLKGSSQLFGFRLTAQVSHALEACLDPVRKGKMKLSPAMVEACTKNMDLLDKLLLSIENSGSDQSADQDAVKLVSELVEAATNTDRSSFALANDSVIPDETIMQWQSQASENNAPILAQAMAANAPTERVETTMTASSENTASIQANSPDFATGGGPQNSAPAGASNGAHGSEATIRVHVALLDRILNIVGELVLVRNQLIQFREKIEDADFQTASKNLDVVTSDLQGEIMKTRMQPIDTVVGKFQRLVRDVARELNKRIDLTLEGSETELDKSLLEAIKDPLTHIVRNACDHGVENPEERKKANKPENGHVLIRSFHEGGQVVIEISDDGRGINRKKVLQKAVEKGLVPADKAQKLSDREICELIFMPGLTTANNVTSVSGRGVGMDVVKTNIEKTGGTVEIKSVEGKGTSIQLRIPLTLAIVPALLIRSGHQKFAIPQVKLVELVHANYDQQGAAGIEYLQGRPMYRLRGSLLPLYDIREITGEAFDAQYKTGVFIVVLNSEGENFGLLVPEVLDTADIVVKPMNPLLNQLSAFSGATILGDGSIGLILDIGGIAEYGKVLNKRNQKEDRESFSKSERSLVSTDIQEFLLFSLGTDALHSLPLCLVNRLEEFKMEHVELSGQQSVVRYRGQLLPLIDLREFLEYPTESAEEQTITSKSVGKIRPYEKAGEKLGEKGSLSVVVVQRSGRSYGLVVSEIVDVATIEGQIDDSIRDRNGILGNLIHKDEVIVVIDALGIVEAFNVKISGKRHSSGEPRDVMGELKELNREMKFKAIRVLYAEDVAFFRKHVSKVLADAGIDVTTVEDGLKALQELDSAEAGRYNLILSDIEMPHMTGLELAREIRKREKFKSVPLIALTTRFRERDVEDGKAAGFNIYLEKLNPDKLLAAVQELMASAGKKEDSEGEDANV